MVFAQVRQYGFRGAWDRHENQQMRQTPLDVWQGVLGHGDSDSSLSMVSVYNLNKRLVVFEIPAGDPELGRTFGLPYLVGEGEQWTQPYLDVRPLSGFGDALPDMIITVRREQFYFVNESGTFRILNDNERRRLEAALAEDPKLTGRAKGGEP